MSRLLPLFSWRSAICESDLPPNTRLVALGLSLYMSERGDSAYPGAERLARDVGLDVRTVRRHLATLLELGWLRCVVRGGGRGHATEYAATIPHRNSDSSDTVYGHQNSDTSDTVTRETVSLVTVNSVTGDTPTPNNSHDDARSVDEQAAIERDFDAWWAVYPRKVSRARARQRYLARRRDGVSHERLLAAARHYASARADTDPRFVKHPDGFLAPDGPWRDWERGDPDRRGEQRRDDWFTMLAGMCADPRPEMHITADVLDIWSRRR